MTSVLDQADPNAINELIARDPLELSDQDIDTIADFLRARRKEFMLEEAKKANRPKTKKPIPQGGLSLGDLNINL